MSELSEIQEVDEENPKKDDAPSSPSKIEDPEKPTDNTCLRTGGIIGGVVIALGIGLLTTLAIKGQ